jgi:hypothetical protein
MNNNKLGTLGVRRLEALLSPRDRAVLQSISDHRFLTTRHIYELHFWDHASYASGIRACTRVLARLGDHKLVQKLERPVGGFGGGSGSTIWALDDAGLRVVKAVEDPDGKRRKPFNPSVLFLLHTLAVADARVTLERTARSTSLELLEVVTEPHNWRPFVATGGGLMTLKPDLFAATASGEFEDHWFLEIDRGTESLSTLIRKCLTYQRYHDAGIAQDAHGVFPLVVWLIPTPQRRARLEQEIASDRRLSPELFRIIDPDQLTQLILNPLIPKGGDTNERTKS